MEEKKAWVDFKLLKSEVTIERVLDHYGINGLRRVGQELRGKCPIHRSATKSKHFSVNLSKNAFKCFSANCGARGNVLDFVAAMENCSIRDAALKLQGWFKIGESQSPSSNQSQTSETAIDVRRGIYRDENGSLFEVIARATSAEDFAELVIYRELSGDYQFWVSPPSAFIGDGDTAEAVAPLFTLVKAL